MANGFDRLKAGLQRRAVSGMCWRSSHRCGRLARKSPAAMKPLSSERSASGRPPGGRFVSGAWILERALTWGPDLSGSLEGAGGVGGLLMMEEKPGSATGVPVGTYYPLYDGNGNITQLLDAAGSVAAHYDYDAFGNVTAATGPAAAHNPWRFSTKPQDPLSGFHYYGYRHYDPVTGRWPSRDPIGERGGINLYGMVGNNPVARWDMLGLTPPVVPPADVRQDTDDWKNHETNCCKGKPRDTSPKNGIALGYYSISDQEAGHLRALQMANERYFGGNAGRVQTLSHMLKSIDETLDCKCISTLYVMGHGARRAMGDQGGMQFEFGTAKGGRDGSTLADKLKGLMCKPCKIVLMGCESGLGVIGVGYGEDQGARAMQKGMVGGFAQMLAFRSGCEVVSMVGLCNYPNARWNVDQDNGIDEARTPGTVRTFNPDGNWRDASSKDYDKSKLP